MTLGRQVIELYQGDFLPDDLYAPWAEMKRMALKDEYITTLMVMADIYQAQDQLDAAAQCCRSVITADPCQEQANGKLMQLYVQQGRRNDAVKVYEKLQANLASDLGVSPDPAITKLYQTIRKE